MLEGGHKSIFNCAATWVDDRVAIFIRGERLIVVKSLRIRELICALFEGILQAMRQKK